MDDALRDTTHGLAHGRFHARPRDVYETWKRFHAELALFFTGKLENLREAS